MAAEFVPTLGILHMTGFYVNYKRNSTGVGETFYVNYKRNITGVGET